MATFEHEGVSYQVSEGEGALEAATPVFPVNFNFVFQGMHRTVSLHFAYPVPVPRRDEVVTLLWDDFGTRRRISASVAYAVHEFFEVGTVPGVKLPGYILQIELAGVTSQN